MSAWRFSNGCRLGSRRVVIHAGVLVRRRRVLQPERDFAADSLQIAQNATIDAIFDCRQRQRRLRAKRADDPGRRISTGINTCIFPVETGGTGRAVEAGCEVALAVRACVTHLEHTTGSVIWRIEVRWAALGGSAISSTAGYWRRDCLSPR